MRIMYNPLTNDEEEVLNHKSATKNSSGGKKGSSGKKGHSGRKEEEKDANNNHSGYEKATSSSAEKGKVLKNIYTLFEGRIHLRADTAI